MNRGELWRRIASRPKAVRFAELERLLLAFGWRFDRAKGDHFIFARGPGERISIPYRPGMMLPTYVRQVLDLTEGERDD